MNYDLEGERADDATLSMVFERAGVLPFKYYASVFDPGTGRACEMAGR